MNLVTIKEYAHPPIKTVVAQYKIDFVRAIVAANYIAWIHIRVANAEVKGCISRIWIKIILIYFNKSVEPINVYA